MQLTRRTPANHTARTASLASLLDNLLAPYPTTGSLNANEQNAVAPQLDISETDACYLIEADVPGVDKDDIDVTVDNNILTIKANSETTETEEDEKGTVIRRERTARSFLRQLRLDESIDEKSISAKYENGVLNLSLPKAKEVAPEKNRIEIS